MSRVQVRAWFSNLPKQDFAGQRILLIIPDSRSDVALPVLFDCLFEELRPACLALDVLVALGANPPLSDAQIAERLGIDPTERGRLFYQTQFFNHDCDREDRLIKLGSLNQAKSITLSEDLLTQDVPVELNSRVQDHDLLLVVSPVASDPAFGYTGGNQCIFPGIAGRQLIDYLDRLGSTNSAPNLAEAKKRPCRLVADALAAMIVQTRRAISYVIAHDGTIRGLFYDTPEISWNAAANLAAN